jgi:hypothetical protein
MTTSPTIRKREIQDRACKKATSMSLTKCLKIGPRSIICQMMLACLVVWSLKNWMCVAKPEPKKVSSLRINLESKIELAQIRSMQIVSHLRKD